MNLSYENVFNLLSFSIISYNILFFDANIDFLLALKSDDITFNVGMICFWLKWITEVRTYVRAYIHKEHITMFH
jgi:hypothetical protein